MNRKQKIVIYIGIFLILVIGLFPPYIGVYYSEDYNIQRFIGYHFLFSSPSSNTIAKIFGYKDAGPIYCYSSFIDKTRISIQMFICFLLIIGILVLLNDNK